MSYWDKQLWRDLRGIRDTVLNETTGGLWSSAQDLFKEAKDQYNNGGSKDVGTVSSSSSFNIVPIVMIGIGIYLVSGMI